jgi:uncharacterized protein involved in tellurium resistance
MKQNEYIHTDKKTGKVTDRERKEIEARAIKHIRQRSLTYNM